MPFYYKILGVLALITIIFSSGMLTEYKFHLAGEVKGLNKQIEKAQNGQNEIIDFNQNIQKVYVKVKEPCLTQPVPVDIQRLLK